MSPAPSDEPLRKVTLNLFAKDVALMEARYGRGWTEEVRRLVAEHGKQIEIINTIMRQR